ncbi:DNA primase catalytic core [Pedobacter sp. UYP24]
MITQDSIDKVKETAEILFIVEQYPDIKLKKRGAGYIGCCPFHDEKSGSFHVTPSKGIYKCFGCGVGGDPISFVMKMNNVDFITAILFIAELYKITVEEKEETPVDRELKDKKKEYLLVNESVAKVYFKHLLALSDDHPVKKELLITRALLPGTIIDFQLGFAPDEWKFITPSLIEKGKYQPAFDLGLISTTNGNSNDVFKNRIIFPIHNERGQVVGFGGRAIQNKKEIPKYLNSRESAIYNKSKILYGLYQAQKAIRDLKFAIIVEGYYDVISMHQFGAPNTVCTGGTAITESHVLLIKRFTGHVVLMGDGDSAGKASNLKAVNLFVKHNIKIEICLLPKPEEGEPNIDPDIFARKHAIPTEDTTELETEPTND